MISNNQHLDNTDEYTDRVRESLQDTLRTAKAWASMDRLFAKGMFHAIALISIDFDFKDIEKECYAESLKLGGFAE